MQQQYFAITTTPTGGFTYGALPKTTNFLTHGNRMQRIVAKTGSCKGFASVMDSVLCKFYGDHECTANLFYNKLEPSLKEKYDAAQLEWLDNELFKQVIEYFPKVREAHNRKMRMKKFGGVDGRFGKFGSKI